MSFEPWQWALLIAGGVMVGLAKTGVPGVSILFVGLLANAMPARQATGVILPLLILGDVFGVLLYRRHTEWRHLWKLFPWTAAGVVLGWFALGRIDDGQTKRLIGVILALLVVLHFWRKSRAAPAEDTVAHAPGWVAAGTGLLAGFTTLVANAAGSVMTIYLLAMRLPKLGFLGTNAVFFLLLNWFKVPFMVNLGLINHDSLWLNLKLAPAVILGCLAGRYAASLMNQRMFEAVALGLTVLAALKLLFL
ncbi:MAG: sulfite exporter TauE/SafE family protein [bacterium]|nr:sulfite exporter TauE/SafE family protein [bacterium]MDI1336031.1 sulfite exporter TauE/SafE family protein [Lacunisphaera sp.]